MNFPLKNSIPMWTSVYAYVYLLSCSNSSWYGIGSSYSGAYLTNTTDNFPASSDVYYILNFNNVFNSYSKLHSNFKLLLFPNPYPLYYFLSDPIRANGCQ